MTAVGTHEGHPYGYYYVRGDTPQTPAKGLALWTPASGSVASKVAWTIPLPPSWKEGGANEISGGHPQTPAKGLHPLDACSLALGDIPQTPAKGLRPLDTCFGECSLKGGVDHPPGPLPGRKGVQI